MVSAVLLFTAFIIISYSARCTQAQCLPPNINIRFRLGGQDTGNVDLCDPPSRAVRIRCMTTDLGISRQWFINNVRDSATGVEYLVFDPGNHTCVITNSCGSSSSASVFIASGNPVISSVSSDPTIIPVGSVSLVCLNTSNPNQQSARLSCEVSDPVNIGKLTWIKDNVPLPQYVNQSVINVTMPGRYTCQIRNACGSDTETTTVNFHPMIIDGSGVTNSSTIDTGANACLDTGTLMMSCNVVAGTVNRHWLRNGTVFNGDSSTLTITPSETTYNYTCVVSNDCSTDTATSIVFRRTAANVSAMITGVTVPLLANDPSGCSRGFGDPHLEDADLCPNIGETVEISCQSSPGSTYTITGPRGNVFTSDIRIASFQMTHSGRYTCRATTECGRGDDSVLILNLDEPPTLTPGTAQTPITVPPGTNGTVAVGDDICLLSNQSADISCIGINGSAPLMYSWTRNGRFLSNEQNLTMVSIGVYNCTVSNAIGSASGITTVLSYPDVELVTNSPSGNRCSSLQRPPPPGTDHCAFAGDQVILQCMNSTAVQNEPTIYFEDDGSSSPSPRIIMSIQILNAGTYFCNASNECGSATDMEVIRVYRPAIVIPKPVPPPGEGELTEVAGRTTEPVCGRDGNRISLHCCYRGFDMPTTRWYFVFPNGTEVPVDTNDPAINVTDDGRGDSVLTIDPFSAQYAGTYRCNTSNIAGNDSADVNVIHKPSEEKEWAKGQWSSCMPDCHRGVRNRTVTCVTVSTRVEMNETGCTGPRPPTQERCSDRGPCTRWVPGPWSQCSKSCGTGFRVRRLQCRTTYSDQVLSDDQCTNERPPVFEYCNFQSCCVEPGYCQHIAGTELCWRPFYQQVCCCTCVE